jgi:predicted amidohydrolase
VVSPDDRVVTVEVEGVILGLSICYDLRFPDLYRALALNGAQVLVVPRPSQYPRHQSLGAATPRSSHRERLLRGCLRPVGPLSAGEAPCFGHSLVVDPWGWSSRSAVKA